MTSVTVRVDITVERKCSQVLIAILNRQNKTLVLTRAETAGNTAKYVASLVLERANLPLHVMVIDIATGKILGQTNTSGDGDVTQSVTSRETGEAGRHVGLIVDTCGGIATVQSASLLRSYASTGEIVPKATVDIRDGDLTGVWITAGVFLGVLLIGWYIILRAVSRP